MIRSALRHTEATLPLGLSRGLLAFRPFSSVVRHPGSPTTRADNFGETSARARRVADAVERVGRWTKSTCLTRALACRLMLARRGEPSVVRLGVAKDGDAFAAHAWLESGAEILTGADGHERFAVIASFVA